MENVNMGFLGLLKKETIKLHKIAEKSGNNILLLNGKMKKFDYLIFLTNEYFLFHSLEENMKLHAKNVLIKDMLFPELNRAAVISADIRAISGALPNEKLKVQTTRVYENRLQEISATTPVLLLAHAYNLYSERLSNGRIISIILKTSYQFLDNALRSYHFKKLNNPREFEKQYSHQLTLLPFDKETKQKFIFEINLSNIFYISLLTEVLTK